LIYVVAVGSLSGGFGRPFFLRAAEAGRETSTFGVQD
jgi:hypothetical protein